MSVIMLKGENGSVGSKPTPSTTSSTTNLTWTDPESNPGLHDDSPVTNRLSHGIALETKIKENYI
jgi:hypothetical protein